MLEEVVTQVDRLTHVHFFLYLRLNLDGSWPGEAGIDTAVKTRAKPRASVIMSGSIPRALDEQWWWLGLARYSLACSYCVNKYVNEVNASSHDVWYTLLMGMAVRWHR